MEGRGKRRFVVACTRLLLRFLLAVQGRRSRRPWGTPRCHVYVNHARCVRLRCDMVNRDGTRAKGCAWARLRQECLSAKICRRRSSISLNEERARRIEFHHEENEESVRCLDDDNRFGRQVFEVSPEKGMRRGITMELKSVKLQIGIRYYDN